MSSTIRRAGLLAASGAAVLAFATACGSSGSTASAPASPSPTNSAPATPMPSEPSNATVKVASNGTLGQIVTDGNGFTLYRFDSDTNSPPTSNCTGSCAATWPAATVTGQPSGSGVSGTLGTITRADGSKQLTLNGWPLYRYSGDSKAGQTNGQGIGGTWWAATPSGGRAMAASTSPTAPPSSGY